MAAAFLTDFGLAKSTATGSRYTRSGEAIGTPAHMAPEQARGEATLTPAADVWALGCVCYLLLAGRLPFDGETSAAVIGQVLTSEPPPVRRVRPDIPADLATLVGVALSKLAGDRPASASEFRDDCDRLLRGERIRARRRRRTPVGRIAVVATVAASLAVWAAARHPGSAPTAPTSGAASVVESESLARQAAGRCALDPRDAARLWGEALARMPDHHAWRIERGLAFWAVGDSAAARAEWSRVPEGAPERATARLYLGLEALLGLRQMEAVEDLRAAATAPPPTGTLAKAAFALGAGRWAEARSHLRGGEGWLASLLRGAVEGGDPEGDRALAARHYEAGLNEGPPFAWAWLNLGSARHDLKDDLAAAQAYTRALVLRPGWRKARRNLGFARHALGQDREALADLDAVLTEEPTDAEALARRGEVLHALGDAAGALTAFEAALALAPDDISARLNRGVALEVLGRLPEAEAAYTATLDLAPQHADALNGRGSVRGARGDPRGALADLDASLAFRPGNAGALTNRAMAHQALGDPAAARADCDAAIAANPAPARPWFLRGNLRSAAGDAPGALSDFDAGLARAPTDGRARLARGAIRASLDDLPGALADTEAAVALEPTFGHAWGNLAKVRHLMGDLDGAAKAMREALRRFTTDVDRGPAQRFLVDCERLIQERDAGGG